MDRLNRRAMVRGILCGAAIRRRWPRASNWRSGSDADLVSVALRNSLARAIFTSSRQSTMTIVGPVGDRVRLSLLDRRRNRRRAFRHMMGLRAKLSGYRHDPKR